MRFRKRTDVTVCVYIDKEYSENNLKRKLPEGYKLITLPNGDMGLERPDKSILPVFEGDYFVISPSDKVTIYTEDEFYKKYEEC